MKILKSTKHRIVLFDGRPIQYHPPFRQAEALKLLDFLPSDFKGPLEVEIGCGKGEFLASRASRFPETFFVGIDRRQDRFELTGRKLSRQAEEKNWRLLHEDARSFLAAGLPKISKLHVYHPDPWPKSKHHKHRFFRSPDAENWARALIPGGELRLSSDHREYFEEIVDILYG